VILVDTTVLVYSVGTDHDLRSPCRDLLRLVEAGRVRATTTVEVLQEFAHVRARRRSRADAVAVARNAAIGLSPLTHPEFEDVMEGLELFRTSERLGAFDAVLAARALRQGWALASADAAFEAVQGLRYLNPASSTVLDEARHAG
jgi:predicted nucleic acid-binding protein